MSKRFLAALALMIVALAAATARGDDDKSKVTLVRDGAIRSQVNDGPVTTYRAGESFSEMPGDRHAVSENASSTEPTRLLAVFVVDSDATTLTTPIH